MERVSPHIIGRSRLSLVTLLCDATRACAKDFGGACAAGVATVERISMGDGAALNGAVFGNESSACQLNGMAENLMETVSTE